jgi:Tfp pilus assembly protein PilO
MPKNFEWLSLGGNGVPRTPRFWLQLTAATLALLNGIVLFLYLDPPGGSRKELTQESQQIRSQIASVRTRAARLRTVVSKVQVGNTESSEFATVYFLPKRTAYERVIEELQRMANASGLQARDAAFTEEPVEGTADLSILNSTAKYEGSYVNLMRFLHEVDHSPMLLMLDDLQAAPEQRGGQIAASIRFQAIVREVTAPAVGGQP